MGAPAPRREPPRRDVDRSVRDEGGQLLGRVASRRQGTHHWSAEVPSLPADDLPPRRPAPDVGRPPRESWQRAKGKGYAVAREIDEERCHLDYTADPSDPDRLLFVTTTGRPVRHNLFYKRTFRPVVKSALAARLHGFRWHDLRHTCAALSLASSPSLAVVKERLGHENVQTTVDLYGKLVPSVDAALADAVGASIFDPPDKLVPLRTAANG